MQTFHELLTEGTQLLVSAGIEEARLDAWLLLEYTADISRAWYYAHPETEAGEETALKYLELCKQRAEHIPLQHLTHQACFMGYDFYVDERVLVPRQDTEVLAEEALDRLKEITNPKILDMCTGSGCIVESILKFAEKKGIHLTGTGCDISEEALKVAEENNDHLKAGAAFVRSDLFERIEDMYDMIVSNPPYIRTEEIGRLEDEVKLHDPWIALDGKEDGLYFYRRIVKDSTKYIKKGGYLLFEIGFDQGKDVAKLMEDQGYEEIQVKKDLAGLDRVVMGRYNKE